MNPNLSHANLWIGDFFGQIEALNVSPFDTVWLKDFEAGGTKEVREFSSRMQLSPQFGLIRLGVVERADDLSIEAQNALLKLLEEPPQSTTLILLAKNESKLLATVRSRCRIFRRNRVAVSDGASQSGLARFNGAEIEAKDADIKNRIEAELATNYQDWCRDNRPDTSLDRLEKLWDLYHNLDTQTSKRLLLERYALETVSSNS